MSTFTYKGRKVKIASPDWSLSGDYYIRIDGKLNTNSFVNLSVAEKHAKQLIDAEEAK